MTRRKFPFPFFNHGTEFDVERIGKNEELFVWFSRPLTAEERAEIVSSAPPPVAGLFAWGDQFAYFGSGGDTYDFDLIEAYAPRQSARINRISAKLEGESEAEDDEEEGADDDFGSLYSAALQVAAPAFLRAFEKWARKVHRLVPIAFLQGPWLVEELSDWGRHSATQLPGALQQVLEYGRVNAALLAGGPGEPGEEGDDWRTALSADAPRYYRYIVDSLSKSAVGDEVALDEPTRLRLIEAQYEGDGLTSPYERMTSSERSSLLRAQQVTALLDTVELAQRPALFARLSAYVRLAYLASYDALTHLVPALTDLQGEVTTLLAQLPPARAAVGPSLVMHLANNLGRVAPAFSTRDPTQAPVAAPLMELACRSAYPTLNMFVSGTMFWLWAKQPQRALALGLEGAVKFPKQPTLLRNIVAAANELNQFEVAEKYSALAKSLEKVPDVARVLNESYAQLKSGKLAAALANLRGYIDAGGADDARVWTNLLSCYITTVPGHALYEKARVEADLARAHALITNDRAFATSVPLVENLAIAYGNHDRLKESVALVDAHLPSLLDQPEGPKHFPSLMQAYSWAGVLTPDQALRRHVQERFEAIAAKHDSVFDQFPASLDNMAAVFCKLGDVDGMFRMLERLKRLKYPALAGLASDPHLASMKDEPKFKAFFASL